MYTLQPTPTDFVPPSAAPTYVSAWSIDDTIIVVTVVLVVALALVLYLYFTSAGPVKALESGSDASSSVPSSSTEHSPLIPPPGNAPPPRAVPA